MASPFASLSLSEQIALPGGDGAWIQIRKLTGRQHEEAQTTHLTSFAANPNKWAGFLRATAADPNSEDVRRVLDDPLTGYDRYVIVKAGLVAWGYERPIDAQAIDDLDDDTIEFIALAILKLSKPGLFQSPDEREQAEKNATGSSTEV